MKDAQCAELPAHTPQGWLKRHHLEETVETSQLCCPHTTSTLVVLLPLQPQPPRRPGFIDHDSCEVDPVSLFFLQVCLLSIVERDPVEDCSTDLVNRIRASAFQGRVTGSKKRPGYIEASKQCMCNSTIPRFGNTDDGLAAKANTNWPTRVDERGFGLKTRPRTRRRATTNFLDCAIPFPRPNQPVPGPPPTSQVLALVDEV